MTQELLIILAKRHTSDFTVVHYLKDNFDTLSEDIRNKLILSLSRGRDDLAVGYLFELVTSNFDRLPGLDPEDLLLSHLSKCCNTRFVKERAATSIISNFDKLPNDVQGLILPWAEDPDLHNSVASSIVDNFDKVSEEVKNLFFRLANKNEVVPSISEAIIDNYDSDKLPKEVKDLLFSFADNKSNARSMLDLLIRPKTLRHLPAEIRDSLREKAKKVLV
jgi:hypothetical protein